MIRLLFVVLAVALATPFPVKAQRVKGAPDVPPTRDLRARAKPRFDPSLWIIDDDYPPAALRAEQEGHVGVLLGIGTDGRASDCTLLASSGSETLDRKSCKLLMRRARFVSAIGKNGKPTADRWNLSTEWKIPAVVIRPPLREDCTDCGWGFVDTITLYPREATPRGDPEKWVRASEYPAAIVGKRVSMDVELGVTSWGKATACRITASNGSGDWSRALCRILLRRARFDAARNVDGERVRGRWAYRYVWDGATR